MGNAVQSVCDFVAAPFVAAYEYVIQPACTFVYDQIIQPTATFLVEQVFEPIYDNVIEPAWDNIIKPTLDVVKKGIEIVKMPFEFIGSTLKDGATWFLQQTSLGRGIYSAYDTLINQSFIGDSFRWVKKQCEPLVDAWNNSAVGSFVNEYIAPVVQLGSMVLGGGVGALATGLSYGKKAIDFMRDPTSVFDPFSYASDLVTSSSAYKAVTDNKYFKMAKDKCNQVQQKVLSGVSGLKKSYESSPLYSKVNDLIDKGQSLINKSQAYYDQKVQPWIQRCNPDRIKEQISSNGFQQFIGSTSVGKWGSDLIGNNGAYKSLKNKFGGLQQKYDKFKNDGQSYLGGFKQKYGKSPLSPHINRYAQGGSSLGDLSQGIFDDGILPSTANLSLGGLGRTNRDTGGSNIGGNTFGNLGPELYNKFGSNLPNSSEYRQVFNKLRLFQDENSFLKGKQKHYQGQIDSLKQYASKYDILNLTSKQIEDSYKAEIDLLRSDNKKYSDQISAFRNEKNIWQSTNDSLQSELNSVKYNLTKKYEDQISASRSRQDIWQGTKKSLQNEVSSFKSNFQKSQLNLASTLANLNQVQSYKIALQEQIGSYKLKFKSYENDIQSLRKTISTYQPFENQNKTLKQRLNETTSQFKLYKRQSQSKFSKLQAESYEVRQLKLKKQKQEEEKKNKIQPIILDNNEKQKLKKFFKQSVKSFDLLYKGSEQGISMHQFYNLHGQKGEIVVVCRSTDNQVIGGYSKLPFWVYNQQFPNNSFKYIKDESLTSFLFSLTSNDKFELKKGHQSSIRRWIQRDFIQFGEGEFKVMSNNTAYTSSANIEYSNPQYKMVNNGQNFKLKQWQVWKVIFN